MRIKPRHSIMALGLLLLLLMMGAAQAQAATAAPACMQPHVSLADAAVVLRTPPGTQLTPADIQRMPDSAFAPVSPRRFLGTKPANWWLRITLHNASTHSCQRWLQIGPNHLHDVHVYLPQDNGWQQMVAGTDHAFDEWPLNERRPVFPVTLAPGTTHIVAQVITSGEITSLSPQLWDPVIYQDKGTTTALRDGLTYGLLILLVAVSLFLGIVFRRWPLCFMALATGFYVVYEAIQKNYLLVYLWPDSVVFNLWALYFFVGLHFAALFGYFYHLVRIQRMGRWQWLFYPLLSVFVLVALLGGLPGHTELASPLVIGLYQFLLWLLAVWYAVRWLSGADRRWFPLLLLGAFCFRSVTTFAPLLGLDITLWGGNLAMTPMLTILGIFLSGTLFSQMYRQRQQQLHAHRALLQQRATESERLERTVAKRTEQLDRALQTRRQLLGRISHDLRSPLAGMLAAVQQWHAGDSRRDYPQLIERNVRQQMAMIDELLAFSHTELAGLQPQPIAGYLYAFLNEIGEQAELIAERQGNRLRRAFADDLPALVCLDYHYLQRVLSNLLGNASKFTQRGRVRFAVEALPTNADHRARLHFIIDDDGPGIALVDRQRLRQPFARGANSAQQQGHGLGLAIVAQLLEYMGSELHIDDAPGGGSRFHFELQAELASESDLEPIIEERHVVDIHGAGRAVLVVDDDAQQREVTCDLLNGYGFDAVAAASAEQALAILHERTVALVITDQYMGGMNGWDLLRRIRSAQANLPVILYSAVPPRPANDNTDIRFDGTLLKPADSGALLRLIESHLDATAERFADPAIRRHATAAS